MPPNPLYHASYSPEISGQSSAGIFAANSTKRAISYYQPNVVPSSPNPSLWKSLKCDSASTKALCSTHELDSWGSTDPRIPNQLQVDAATRTSRSYGFDQSPPSLFLPNNAFPGQIGTIPFHPSSNLISSASPRINPQREHTFQLLPEISRLSSTLPATFPLTQVAYGDAFVRDQEVFNGDFVQDTSSRHLLCPFSRSPPEETGNWPPLLQSDGTPIVSSSQRLSGEHPEWTTLPMRYQVYPYDTPSAELSVDHMPYDFTASAALFSQLLNGLVNEETLYTGRQTQFSISTPDVFNAPPQPLNSITSEMIHFIPPNHAAGIASSSTLPSLHVQPSLTSGFLMEYHNPATVLEIQDSDSDSYSPSLTFNSSSHMSSAEREFNIISLPQDISLEDLSGPQFADDSRACYQPILAAVSRTNQTHHPPTSLTPPHSHPIGSSSSKAPRHQKLLESAFRPHSAFPNEARARLLDIITQSSFIQTHEIEPSIDSSEGQALLKDVWGLADCPLIAFQKSNLSIYTLLLDIESRTCLICKSSKSSLDRAIGCVRSHLDHRPFVCEGDSVGCGRCKGYARPRRFFCLPYVVDHLKGQSKKFKCPYLNCKTSLRRGGMVRHWNRKHSHSPFPKELFSGYGKTNKQNRPPL